MTEPASRQPAVLAYSPSSLHPCHPLYHCLWFSVAYVDVSCQQPKGVLLSWSWRRRQLDFRSPSRMRMLMLCLWKLKVWWLQVSRTTQWISDRISARMVDCQHRNASWQYPGIVEPRPYSPPFRSATDRVIRGYQETVKTDDEVIGDK